MDTLLLRELELMYPDMTELCYLRIPVVDGGPGWGKKCYKLVNFILLQDCCVCMCARVTKVSIFIGTCEHKGTCLHSLTNIFVSITTKV